jgi:hypothetical protein
VAQQLQQVVQDHPAVSSSSSSASQKLLPRYEQHVMHKTVVRLAVPGSGPLQCMAVRAEHAAGVAALIVDDQDCAALTLM